MRILHFTRALDRESGGPSRSVPMLVVSTIKAGASVELVTQLTSGKVTREAGEIGRLGGKVHYVPELGVAEALLSGSRMRALQKIAERHDLIHVNGIWSPICHVGCRMARELGKPLVISPHGMLEPWALSRRWLKKKAGWWTYQRRDMSSAALVRATADSEARALRALGADWPIAVLPNGMQLPVRLPAIRRGGKRKALFLSRIHPKKGLEDLVHVVSVLKQELDRAGWQIVVAGYDEGGYLRRVRQKVENMGVAHLFSFPGPVEGRRKQALFRSADIFVLPTHSENFGMVVAEALGCGVPVITTHGAPWPQIERYRCGWWVPIGPAGLERALREAIRLPRRQLRAMGARGRDLVRREFSWDVIGRQFLSAYKWLLRDGKRPGFIYLPGRAIPNIRAQMGSRTTGVGKA